MSGFWEMTKAFLVFLNLITSLELIIHLSAESLLSSA